MQSAALKRRPKEVDRDSALSDERIIQQAMIVSARVLGYAAMGRSVEELPFWAKA